MVARHQRVAAPFNELLITLARHLRHGNPGTRPASWDQAACCLRNLIDLAAVVTVNVGYSILLCCIWLAAMARPLPRVNPAAESKVPTKHLHSATSHAGQSIWLCVNDQATSCHSECDRQQQDHACMHGQKSPTVSDPCRVAAGLSSAGAARCDAGAHHEGLRRAQQDGASVVHVLQLIAWRMTSFTERDACQVHSSGAQQNDWRCMHQTWRSACATDC